MEALAAQTPTRIRSKYVGEAAVADWLVLDYATRQRARFVVMSSGGRECAVSLSRGGALSHGERLLGEDGTVFGVVAEAEQLSRVACASATEFARACYHLGNRHAPVQIGDGWLLYQSDHVLDRLMAALGLRVTSVSSPFQPEPGAYAKHQWEAPALVRTIGAPEVSDA